MESDIHVSERLRGKRWKLLPPTLSNVYECVSVLVFGSSGPGSSSGRRHCVVFLSKTLNTHRASLQWVPANLILGVPVRWTSIPSRGGGGGSRDKQIQLVSSCYRGRDKLQPDGPLGSYADFILYLYLCVKIDNSAKFEGEH